MWSQEIGGLCPNTTSALVNDVSPVWGGLLCGIKEATTLGNPIKATVKHAWQDAQLVQWSCDAGAP